MEKKISLKYSARREQHPSIPKAGGGGVEGGGGGG